MKSVGKILICFFVFQFVSCNLFSAEKCPYSVKAQLVFDDSECYDFMGLDFKIKNNDERAIQELTLVFYVFDEDGEPASGVKNNIVLKLKCEIPGGELLEDCISLDKYVYNFDSENYEIDYLYVSKIVYDDGSVWTDPFGNVLLK
jgi:hypothetical protein